MTLKKFDDADGTEIPLTAGLEVSVRLVDGTTKVQHFAIWDHIPKRLLDGTVGGTTVAAVQIRDLAAITATTPDPNTPAALRAARIAAIAG